MANTYATSMFPLGSTEVKVLFNNASNLDDAVNDMLNTTWVDRFGLARRTWFGIEKDARDALIAGGYEFIGDYDSPGELTFTRANQIMSNSGEFWRPAATLTLPYTTVNNWGIDQPKFVSVGDAALRTELATAVGATMVGFKNSYVGSLLRTVNSRLDGIVEIEDFGALGGSNDDTVPFASAAAWARARSPLSSEIRFKQAKYTAVSPNWCVDGLKLTTVGSPEIALPATASSTDCALLMDGEALVPGKSYYRMVVGDFKLKGRPNTLAVFRTANVTHSKFGQLQASEADPLLGAGFRIEWGVCNTYELMACSTNETTMTSIPLRGLYITLSGVLPSTDCTFNQVIMEGPTVGIQLANGGADLMAFLGGTAENCSNTGVSVGPGCHGNYFLNMAMEANGSFDFSDQGIGTRIEGGYSTGTIQFSVAIGSSIRDMRGQTINIASDCARIEAKRCTVSNFAPGGSILNFVPSSPKENASIITDVFNANTGAYAYQPLYGRNPTTAFATITVGASPFTYTHSSVYDADVIIGGANVTSVVLNRGANAVQLLSGALGAVNTVPARLSGFDSVTVTYTGVATMTLVPR